MLIIAIFSTPKPPTKPSRKAAVKSVISYQLSVISYQLSVGKLSDLSFKWGLLKKSKSTPAARRAQVPGAPTVTDFVHNVGANCVRPKGT
ncbi:MAG: hypothetical protein EWV46_09700 [Microcystis viridis Mv_BB_P_19951000_S69D]|nr:MAG: hypothetical protein EWV46_09700 [Microcystis viridis Mv_BB_P_19951000_S69D]